jgi:uncharacterized RDD family membrane protein YckC
MQYAGFWIRLAAYVIDYIVVFVAQMIIYTIFGVSMFGAASMDPEAAGMFESTGSVLAVLITSVGGILYYVLMESSAKQATLGKMAVGLIVTDDNGGRMSFMRALGRFFAKILSAMILFIGFIMIGFTERKQGLHDIICSTLVVKGKPGEVGVDTDVFA